MKHKNQDFANQKPQGAAKLTHITSTNLRGQVNTSCAVALRLVQADPSATETAASRCTFAELDASHIMDYFAVS